MDSMRHLSKSLPYTQRAAQTQELLVDFKAAALSVTNLYKSAASAQLKARAAGYQDALDDLLSFLDRENLGLMDGEGWRVRQWATERLDDAIPRPSSSDDEDEGSREAAYETRSSTPETQRKPASAQTSNGVPDESLAARRGASEPPHHQQPLSTSQPTTNSHVTSPSFDVPTADFTFRSTQTYPIAQDRDSNPMEVDNNTDSMRLLTRAKSRNTIQHRARSDIKSSSVSLGSGAGSKRKIPYPDFFDITGFNFEVPERKDVNSRGKKGRFT